MACESEGDALRTPTSGIEARAADGSVCNPVSPVLLASPLSPPRRQPSLPLTAALPRRSSSARAPLPSMRTISGAAQAPSPAAKAVSPRTDVSTRLGQLMRDGEGMQAGEALGEDGGTDDDSEEGRCTEANKHLVVGALDVLDAARWCLPILAEELPVVTTVLFLLSVVLQRFEPVVRVPLFLPGTPVSQACNCPCASRASCV